MLARAMEKDLVEQQAAEEKEKDNLMKEAMEDPLFKAQMENLQQKKAAGQVWETHVYGMDWKSI